MEARLDCAVRYFPIENREQLPGILSQLSLQRNVLLAASRRVYAKPAAPPPRAKPRAYASKPLVILHLAAGGWHCQK